MRLLELEVHALPGIDSPYELTGVSAGVTVVVGPNASGKSSLVRALRSLWQVKEHELDQVHVVAHFEQRGEAAQTVKWRAERRGLQVTWEKDGERADPPPPPPEHLLHSYLISIEALMEDGRTDAAIGDRLHREMSGGYDLPAARSKVELSREGYQRDANQLEAARRKLEELQRSRAALWSRLQERGELREQQGRAAAHAALRERYEAALKLTSRRAELQDARAQLAAYPPVMARVSGTEVEALEGSKRDEVAARVRLERAERELAEARAALAETGLAHAEPSAAAVDAVERSASKLEELQAKRADLELREAEARAALREPWRVLGGGANQLPRAAFDPDNLTQVEQALGDRMAAQARLEAARAELDRLEAERRKLEEERVTPESGPLATTDAELDEGQLHAAQAALSAWLAAPRLPPRPQVRLWPTTLLFLAAVLFALAGVLALGDGSAALEAAWPQLQELAAGRPLWLASAGGGALLLLIGLVATLVTSVGGARSKRRFEQELLLGPEADAAQAALERAGARPPVVWEHDAVAQRLGELQAHASERRVLTRRAAVLGQQAQDTLRQQSAAESAIDIANHRLRKLAATTGYDAGAGEAARTNAGFAAWLRAVRQVNDLTDRLHGLLGERRQLEQQADQLCAEVQAALRGTPFALEGVPTGPARWHQGAWHDSKLPHASAARAACEELVAAVKRRDAARQAEERAAAELERARRELSGAVAARAALLERLELDPSAADAEARLHALVADLPDWRAADGRVRQLEAVAAELQEGLAEHPDIQQAALAGDVATLQLGLAAARDAATEQDELSERIGALDAEVRAAERERQLEHARAEVQQRQDAVEDHRRRAQLNDAATLLFDDVEREHQAKRQPEVLKRARAWFERFTHHAFELVFDPNAPRALRLRARDVSSGRLLAPSQLSTGTRAQLLLALRVAHASHAEEGHVRLPFFLDEALTTADAGRFAQVATSLLELAHEDGRQVIYLSARGEDAATWQRVAQRFDDRVATLDDDHMSSIQVVDLAEVRRLGSAGSWAGAPYVARERTVPDPNEVPVGEFARALGVQPIDPWQEPNAVHLFHLFLDDYTPLRRLAQAHILTAGQAKSLLRSISAPGANELVPGDLAALLRRRIAGLEGWHRAWRQGRNLPVDAAALRASGAVSGTFMTEVSEAVREVKGDPRALLEALRDGRVAYFRAAAVDALEAWLDEHGFFDTRPQLDESQRMVVTAEALAGASEEGADFLLEARQLVERLEAALKSEREHV